MRVYHKQTAPNSLWAGVETLKTKTRMGLRYFGPNAVQMSVVLSVALHIPHTSMSRPRQCWPHDNMWAGQ